MLYTAFLKFAFSTHDNICIYLLILYNFYDLTLIGSITQLSHICFLQPLLGLSLAHTVIYVYVYR